jgi:hypothetical protein
MASIVGVHGVGNYRAGHPPQAVAAHLAQKWKAHLSAGPLGRISEKFTVTTAYYSHYLSKPGRQGAEISIEHLDPLADEMLRKWLEQWNVEPGLAQGRGTAPVRQALSWIADRQRLARPAVEKFVAVFFNEVARYLAEQNAPWRISAASEVARVIAEAVPPRTVLAHSLGSVITYEALWANPDLNVDFLVSIGSPLALPHAVFPRLQPQPIARRGRRPPCVQRWFNLADIGDLVAIPRGGILHSFDGIFPQDDFEGSIHTFDFHRVANYLRCPQLATMLWEYL